MAARRTTARVLPVSPDGAVLLLQEQDPARPGQLYWASIGGGTEPGEPLRNAATRELYEEVGLAVPPDALLGPVFEHDQDYSWNGVDYAGHHTYFALPLDRGTAISFDLLEPEEVGNVLAADWWLPEAVGAVEHRPPPLPEVMALAVDAVRSRS